MANFERSGMTQAGINLMGKAIGGATIQFTKLVLGDGEITGEILNLQGVVSPKQNVDVTRIERNDNQCTVGGELLTSSVKQGFFWRECGLYAMDPDIGEILYNYAYSTKPDYIAASDSEMMEEILISMIALVGANANVDITIDDSMVFATKKVVDKKTYYYPTIADMKADISLKDGDMAITLGYYAPKDGGNSEYEILLDNSLVDDGGSVHTLDNGLKAKIATRHLNELQFGVKADGETDDRQSLQNYIDYCQSVGNSIKLISDTNSIIAIKSTHPEYTDCGIVVTKKHMNLESSGFTQIKYIGTSNITSLFELKKEAEKFSCTNLYFNANNRCDYAFAAYRNAHDWEGNTDSIWYPYLNFRKVWAYRAKEANFNLITYVSSFNNCIAGLGEKIGFNFPLPIDSIQTSINMTSCYANNNPTGYKFRILTYSTLVNCACDHSDLSYEFDAAFGVSMIGCGSENFRQGIKAASAHGFTINSFFLMAERNTAENKAEYLLEFGQGSGITISGLVLRNAIEHYKYKLGLTTLGWHTEAVAILDNCISRGEVYVKGATSSYDIYNLVRFMFGDKTRISTTINCNAWDIGILQKKLNYLEVNHDLIYKIDCSQRSDRAFNFEGISGSGTLTFEGKDSNVDNNRFHAGACTWKNVSCHVVFKNLTFTNSGWYFFEFINCKNIRFENCKFVLTDFDPNVWKNSNGLAILKNSHVYYLNSPGLGGGNGSYGNDVFTYEGNSSATIESNSLPTEGIIGKGVIIKINPSNATLHEGWVCINKVWAHQATGTEFKKYNVFQ